MLVLNTLVCFFIFETFFDENFFQKHHEIMLTVLDKLLDMCGLKLRAGKPPQ